MDNIIITGRYEELTEALRDHNIKTIISINDTTKEEPELVKSFPEDRTLILHFNDVDCPQNPNGPSLVALSSLLNYGIDLLRLAIEEDGLCLIHCTAGICRSTAAAAIVLATHLPPGSELEAMQEVLRIRPIADPNWLMLSIADKYWGTKLVPAKEFIEPFIRQKFSKRYDL